MPAEVFQSAGQPPGVASIGITGIGALDPASVMFSIEQPSRGFLQDPGGAPFGTTQAWLQPYDVTPAPGGIQISIGPAHSWGLKAHVTYLLRVRDAQGEQPAQRLAWIAIRMPSQPPDPLSSPVRLGAHPGATSDGDETLVVKEPVVVVPARRDPATLTDTDTEPPPRRLALPLAALALVLAAAGGGFWWFYLHPQSVSPASVVATTPAEGPLGPQTARRFLGTGPDAKATFIEAERYLKDGSPDALQGALLLLDNAGRAGSAAAETKLGEMYDPATFSAKTSAMAAPDPAKALLHYERAAKAEDPEALFRRGKLLMSGAGDGIAAGPEQGVRDLQRAAALGYPDAQQELDKLKNQAK